MLQAPRAATWPAAEGGRRAAAWRVSKAMFYRASPPRDASGPRPLLGAGAAVR